MSRKILVAVDGSSYSIKAYEQALEEAQSLGNQLTILKVVQTYDSGGEKLEEALQEKIKDAENLTERLKKQGEEKGIEAEAEVITDTDAATGIVKFADENDFDQIVIGSRGKTDLETIQLGSVSEGVIKKAHCPVLVIK